MKRLHLLVINIVLIINGIDAQDKFTVIFESEHDERGWDVIQSLEGGFAITGQTSESNDDVILIKTSSTGETIFRRTYGGSSWDYGYSMIQNIDSNFVIAGSTNSFGAGNQDIYLVKIRRNGDTVWTKTYGGLNDDGGGHVQRTCDSGFVVVGYTASFGPNFENAYLIKTDSTGDTVWTKILALTEDCFSSDLVETADGGYLIAGTAYLESPHVILIKTDSTGDTVWSRIYDFYTNSHSESLIATDDGNYLIIGTANFYKNSIYQSDLLLIKTDISGDTIWTKTFGGILYDYGFSVQNTADHGYIAVGSTDSTTNFTRNIYLVNTNSQGSIIWTKSYDLLGTEEGYAVKQTMDKGFCITGYTHGSSGKEQIFLMKVDSLGVSDIIHTPVRDRDGPSDLKFYPNPITTELHIQREGTNELLVEITDLQGKRLYQMMHRDKHIIIDMSRFATGLYLMKLQSPDRIQYMKIIRCT